MKPPMVTEKIFSPQRTRKTESKPIGNSIIMVSLWSLRLRGRIFTYRPPPCPVQLFIFLLMVCSLPTEFVHAESVDSNIQSGITDYRQQNFDQAEINFSKALKKKPDNPELNYNLANSHYKNGKYQEALKSYSQATAENTPPDLQQKSLYNSGNALYRMDKLEESIAAYKKVLEMNPKDMDAKFNLEFVREKLKEKKEQDKQKQNQPQDKDSKGNQDPQQKPSPENNSEKDNQDKGQNSAQQENQPPSPPKEPDQNSDSSEPVESNPSELAEENTISKEQADQWLSGLDEDLKKFSQKQAREQGGKAPASNRDW